MIPVSTETELRYVDQDRRLVNEHGVRILMLDYYMLNMFKRHVQVQVSYVGFPCPVTTSSLQSCRPLADMVERSGHQNRLLVLVPV